MIVTDCSVLVSGFLPDESNEFSENILEQLMLDQLRATVPGIFYLELQNTLLMALRRKRINQNIWSEYLEIIPALPIDVDYGSCEAYVATAIAKIARQYQLTTYDAAYVELAKRKKMKLATLDKKLNKVAVDLGCCFSSTTIH